MKKKILVIEDEIGIRENLTLLLEMSGYLVSAASNGRQGIETAREFAPDLIICDIMMPNTDGYMVLKSCRADSKLSIIPFLFLTAKVERSDLRKGMNLGADDYLFKPYDSDELLSAVRTRIERHNNIVAYFAQITNSSGLYDMNDKIRFRVRDQIVFVPISRILYISADRQYTQIYTLQLKKYLTRKTLSVWEKTLPPNNFVRIHRSTLINKEYIDRIEKEASNGYVLYLKHSPIPFTISRRCYKNISNL